MRMLHVGILARASALWSLVLLAAGCASDGASHRPASAYHPCSVYAAEYPPCGPMQTAYLYPYPYYPYGYPYPVVIGVPAVPATPPLPPPPTPPPPRPPKPPKPHKPVKPHKPDPNHIPVLKPMKPCHRTELNKVCP
jgi:hypothetical protein